MKGGSHVHVVERVGERVRHDDRPVDRKKKLLEGVPNDRNNHLWLRWHVRACARPRECQRVYVVRQ